jgi:hypothetical protein
MGLARGATQALERILSGALAQASSRSLAGGAVRALSHLVPSGAHAVASAKPWTAHRTAAAPTWSHQRWINTSLAFTAAEPQVTADAGEGLLIAPSAIAVGPWQKGQLLARTGGGRSGAGLSGPVILPTSACKLTHRVAAAAPAAVKGAAGGVARQACGAAHRGGGRWLLRLPVQVQAGQPG